MSPRDQERRFERAYGATLLAIAEQDLRTAAYTAGGVESGDARPETVLFLFQQAAEKALKAAICALDLPVPLVHDLGVLLAKLPEDEQPDVGYELTRLNEFAGVRRYEEGHLRYTDDDIEEARSLVTDVVTWARSIVRR